MCLIKGSGFILIDKEEKFLLQHRDKDALWHPNYWGFFGGAIENDETPEQAVRREAKEELQIELINLEFFKKYDIPLESGLFRVFIFIAPLIFSIEKLGKQQKEGQNLGLFTLEKIKDLKIDEYDKIILEDLFSIK